MKATYVAGSEAVPPLDNHITKVKELIDPMHPEKGTTDKIIFPINEIWATPEDI